MKDVNIRPSRMNEMKERVKLSDKLRKAQGVYMKRIMSAVWQLTYHLTQTKHPYDIYLNKCFRAP